MTKFIFQSKFSRESHSLNLIEIRALVEIIKTLLQAVQSRIPFSDNTRTLCTPESRSMTVRFLSGTVVNLLPQCRNLLLQLRNLLLQIVGAAAARNKNNILVDRILAGFSQLLCFQAVADAFVIQELVDQGSCRAGFLRQGLLDRDGFALSGVDGDALQNLSVCALGELLRHQDEITLVRGRVGERPEIEQLPANQMNIIIYHLDVEMNCSAVISKKTV